MNPVLARPAGLLSLLALGVLLAACSSRSPETAAVITDCP